MKSNFLPFTTFASSGHTDDGPLVQVAPLDEPGILELGVPEEHPPFLLLAQVNLF
jgi:hypothetical protein